ncbi:MAG: HAD-IA family hydrolase [Xanthomonadaceae bacterium]|nr:HAD-IA family hydrolase [Xanthomonadaceae bacterium]
MTDLQATGPVRAITFDLDFTLWDLEGVIHRAEMLQYQFLCQHYPEVGRRYSAEAFQALRFRLHEQRPDLRYNVTLLRQEALRTVAIECGYDESLVKQAFQVFLDARHDVKLYDDTVPLLERLHGRYVLGVITNGNADVRRLGLGGYFDFTLSPMEVGAAKPDRLIFEAACNRAGFEPGEIVHIGDDPEADVIGAAGYGMVAVWLNRHRLQWPAELPRPDCIELPTLAALERVLQPPLAVPCADDASS